MNEATALILQRRIEAFFDVDPVPDDQFREMLTAMRADFPASAIGKLPRITCPDCSDRSKQCSRHQRRKCELCDNYHSTAAIHLDFVGHAHLTERLNEVDPGWDWLPAAFDDDGLPKLTGGGNLWIILRFGGRFFQGVGDAPNKKGGDALKEMIGDALRNVGMRRGAALSLWMKERDVPEGEGDDAPVNGTAAPATETAKAAAAAPTAKKAPAKKAAAKKAASPPPATAATADEIAELTAALAALPEPDKARSFITGRGVDPDTWEGLDAGKVRAIRSAITNMGRVQTSGAATAKKAASAPPASPPPPPAPAPEGPGVRAELAERAAGLPEHWASVLRQEIAQASPGAISGGTEEHVMQAPDGPEWDQWLETWISDAEAKLLQGVTSPPGGEPFE